MADLIGWLFVIALLLILAAGVASFFLWGGVKRGALGHLMAGALLLVSGAVFQYVPQINAFARMDNAYLGNGFLGLFLVLLGLTLLIGSLVGYRMPVWLAALLWPASIILYWFGSPLLQRIVPFPNDILLFPALLLGAILLYIAVRGYPLEAVIAFALTSAGFALAWRLSGGDLRAFTPVRSIDEPFYKPPVLDIEQLLICLLVATLLFLVGRFLQGRLRGQRPRATVAPA